MPHVDAMPVAMCMEAQQLAAAQEAVRASQADVEKTKARQISVLPLFCCGSCLSKADLRDLESEAKPIPSSVRGAVARSSPRVALTVDKQNTKASHGPWHTRRAADVWQELAESAAQAEDMGIIWSSHCDDPEKLLSAASRAGTEL